MHDTDRELLMRAATKAEAIALGLKRYFTGRPCRRGHTFERYANSGACVECQRVVGHALYARDREKRAAKHAAWQKENAEAIAERYKRYYEANKEARSASYKAYRQANPEKEAARHKRYQNENREVCRERGRQYRLNNPDVMRAKWAKRRSIEAGAEGKFTAADIERIAELQRGRCANCRCKLVKFHIDHIEPLSRGGSNWPSNLQLLCPPCNLRKHAKAPERWAAEQGRLL